MDALQVELMPGVRFQDFLEKMKAAGIDEYIAAAQAQLDECLANK